MYIKIRCCELFFGFRRPNVVVYSIPNLFPLYQPIMKNCLLSYNLNKIHIVLCRGCILLMIPNQLFFFHQNPKCIFDCINTNFCILFYLCFCIMCLVKNFFIIGVDVQHFPFVIIQVFWGCL